MCRVLAVCGGLHYFLTATGLVFSGTAISVDLPAVNNDQQCHLRAVFRNIILYVASVMGTFTVAE
jgi:hypothetical protein